MRTVLVNPRNPYFATAEIPRRGMVAGALSRSKPKKANGRRRRVRRNAMILANPRRRRSRRNPVLSPVLANPRRRRSRRNPTLANPRRRRHARRNPSFNLMQIAKGTMYAVGGAGLAYAVNKYGISKLMSTLERDYTGSTPFVAPAGMAMRGAARIAAAVVAGMFLPSALGSPAAACMFYPSIQELDIWWASRQAAAPGAVVEPTAADLRDLEADLSDVLDDLNY